MKEIGRGRSSRGRVDERVNPPLLARQGSKRDIIIFVLSLVSWFQLGLQVKAALKDSTAFGERSRGVRESMSQESVRASSLSRDRSQDRDEGG